MTRASMWRCGSGKHNFCYKGMLYERCRTLPARLALLMTFTQGYASNYSSHARIDRLLFIAAVSRDASVIQEAFRLAHDDVKQVGGLQAKLQRARRSASMPSGSQRARPPALHASTVGDSCNAGRQPHGVQTAHGACEWAPWTSGRVCFRSSLSVLHAAVRQPLQAAAAVAMDQRSGTTP